MERSNRVLRRAVVLALLLVVFVSAAALAVTPEYGRVRIVGYKDEIPKPMNKFAPYAVYDDIAHIQGEYYLHFDYMRESSSERHWTIYAVDAQNRDVFLPEGLLAVYLPYPSIWSSEHSTYWKWTKRFALERYSWEYAFGQVLSEYNGEYVDGSWYVRNDYQPVRVKHMTEFGPRVYVKSDQISCDSISVWVRIDELE